MKKITVILTAFLCLGTLAMQAQTKIGYINSLELLSYMPEVQHADSLLKVMANDLQKQYGSYVMEYQKQLNDYKQNSATWSDVIREAKEKDLGDLESRINDYEQTSQQKLADKKKELYDPLVNKANDAIQAVGKENKFTCILDSSAGALIYAGDDMVNIMSLVKPKLNIK